MDLIHHATHLTREETMTGVFFYIESFYNRQRRHSTLRYLSPLAFEARYQEQMVTV